MCDVSPMTKQPSIQLAYRDDASPGQPWVVTHQGRELVRKDRGNGVAQAVIAGRLGMNATSFRSAMERDDDLRAAYDEGSGAMETELVGLLMQSARDGDRTSAIFLLKGACGFRENTPVAPKADAPAINITIPPALSHQDLLTLTQQMKSVTPDDPSTPESTDAAPSAQTAITRN